MISLRNTWTKLCEALGPASAPALEPPAPPIWVAGHEYYGKLSAQDKASIGLDDDSSFPSMSDPPKQLASDPPSDSGAAAPAAASTTTTTTTTTNFTPAGRPAAGQPAAAAAAAEEVQTPMRKVCS